MNVLTLNTISKILSLTWNTFLLLQDLNKEMMASKVTYSGDIYYITSKSLLSLVLSTAPPLTKVSFFSHGPFISGGP